MASLQLSLLAGSEQDHEVVIPLHHNIPPEQKQRVIVFGIPRLGQQNDHHLFATFRVNDGKVSDWKDLGGWNQQRNMQPSHIRKQERSLDISDVSWSEEGGLSFTMRAQLATPRQLGQDAVRETFTLAVSLQPGDRAQLPDLRTTRAIPPWRRKDRPMQGSALIGRVSGSAMTQIGDQAETTRPIDQPAYAGWQAADYSGAWFLEGDATTSYTQMAEGLRITVDLPTVKTDAGEGGGITRRLQEAVPIPNKGAVRVVWSCEQAHGAQWSVRIFDRGQGWYTSPPLLHLRPGRHEAIIPLRTFVQNGGFDMDHWFNADQVERIGFRVSNGEGLGPSTITIHSLSFVPYDDLPQTAQVAVSPDTLWGHNGSTTIPNGLFGAHVVWVPDQQEVIAKQRENGVRSLRPIVHGAFDSRPSDRREIRQIAPMFDEDVEILESLTGKPLMSPAPWHTNEGGIEGELQRWRDFGKALAQQQQDDELPFQRVEIWNEPFMWARFMNRPGMARDPAQHNYLPGPYLSQRYAQLANALIDAHREAGGTIQFGGPSSAYFGSDNWRHLSEHVLPVALAGAGKLDFVSEHHYIERGELVAASYEAFQAQYMQATGKRLPIINTEANDLVDQPGKWSRDETYHPGGVDRRRFSYQVGDIMAQLRFHNDHVLGRHIHALWRGRFAKKGEAIAYRWFRPFSGDLVQATSDHPDLWALASREGDQGAVALYNDGDQELRVSLSGIAMLASTATLVSLSTEDGLSAETVSLQPHYDGLMHISLPPISALMVELSALPKVRHHINREVHYAKTSQRGGLWSLGPDESLELSSTAARADHLRLTVSGALNGYLVAEFMTKTGEKISMPLDGFDIKATRIMEIPLPPNIDTGSFQLRATAQAGQILILAAALVDEQTRLKE